MGHHTVKPAYRQLVERLNRFPQGAPPTKVLYQILAMLFSAREAELVAQLPIRPFNAARAARNWRLDLNATRRILDELAGRAILFHVDQAVPQNHCAASVTGIRTSLRRRNQSVNGEL